MQQQCKIFPDYQYLHGQFLAACLSMVVTGVFSSKTSFWLRERERESSNRSRHSTTAHCSLGSRLQAPLTVSLNRTCEHQPNWTQWENINGNTTYGIVLQSNVGLGIETVYFLDPCNECGNQGGLPWVATLCYKNILSRRFAAKSWCHSL